MARNERRAGWMPAAWSTGVLARLCRDTRGNTLAIVAASLVPLTAMIGSGLDMSRAYLAQNRLQLHLQMWGAIYVLAFIGAAATLLITVAERFALHWHSSQRD